VRAPYVRRIRRRFAAYTTTRRRGRRDTPSIEIMEANITPRADVRIHLLA